jgi:hypothetical protein
LDGHFNGFRCYGCGFFAALDIRAGFGIPLPSWSDVRIAHPTVARDGPPLLAVSWGCERGVNTARSCAGLGVSVKFVAAEEQAAAVATWRELAEGDKVVDA